MLLPCSLHGNNNDVLSTLLFPYLSNGSESSVSIIQRLDPKFESGRL